MLIDWEKVGPDRSFEIPVRDLQKARCFYMNVLGARETFRGNSEKGELIRLGFQLGKINFVLSSSDHASETSAVLSRLSEEFGVPYAAIILSVDDLDHMLCKALKNGAQLVEASSSGDIAVVKDPFGGYWAFTMPKTVETSSPFRLQQGYGDALRH
jgi:uncharacterized glyoxalase superfamily protein PhnB